MWSRMLYIAYIYKHYIIYVYIQNIIPHTTV